MCGALWVLSEQHMPNKVAISEAGAIKDIVAQLSPASSKSTELAERAHYNASNALTSLADGNPANQAEITPLLVSLLEPGPKPVRACTRWGVRWSAKDCDGLRMRAMDSKWIGVPMSRLSAIKLDSNCDGLRMSRLSAIQLDLSAIDRQ